MTASWPATVELRCGPVGAIDLALYAAASGDHNPLHLDADVARAALQQRLHRQGLPRDPARALMPA